MRRGRSRHEESETGQILILAALMMTVLLGMVSLSIDIGRFSLTRRQAQNAADAAAYAGASFLPTRPDDAIDKAKYYSSINGFGTLQDTTSPVVETYSQRDDTIYVTVTRNVQYMFAQALGLSKQQISASARVRAYVATGFQEGPEGVFPFAVWGGNLDWDDNRQPGNQVTYRSNQWGSQVDDNVRCSTKDNRPNCRWRGNRNSSFKGYLHHGSGWINISPEDESYDEDESRDVWDIQGGNAQGTQFRDSINTIAAARGVIRIPVIDRVLDAPGRGFNARVSGFLCIEPDRVGNGMSGAWTGTIKDSQTDSRCTALNGVSGGTRPYGTKNVYAVKLID